MRTKPNLTGIQQQQQRIQTHKRNEQEIGYDHINNSGQQVQKAV